ncbi:succinate dehydrogenase/fumarate reductase iron-sulfur subunit [Brotaphodocola sp.]|uniref:succinate dehydrogenase/fumarate reductase iron-sulfur subunit n=1 Tax=Brotaphodocola sp. TaxID=3073577 RepID=UPI003D7E2BF3
MTIEISVKRQNGREEKPYIQKFSYTGDGNLTVADWLTEVNQKETKADRIAWECGCLEKKCGACAMVINGYPSLACSIFLKNAGKRGKITLEPFHKFPLIKDLIVDRSTIFDTMKQMKIWMSEKNLSDYSWNRDLQYKAGQCLQCGCCLEVCPNFLAGKGFAGASAMVEAYRAIEQNDWDDHRDEMKKEYRKRFFNYCGQSFSCQSVCPQKLPLEEIQARANGH